MNKHIFVIAAGCIPVAEVMLKSFFKYHNEKIHIYLFTEDVHNFKVSVPPGSTASFVCHLLPESLKEPFARGHEGTAKAWARIMKQNPDAYLIQIDSDVVFKQESLSLIEKAGYPDIYGSRRCYQNNPGKAPVHPGIEDAISTYFLGFNPSFLGSLIKDDVLYPNLERMIQGVYNPLGFPCLDFFDPVFFYARSQGANVHYEDPNKIGGQNEQGSKANAFKSNLHLDMGSHLAHFGGVGSGYANEALRKTGKTPQGETSYVKWSIHRWNFFNNLLIDFTRISGAYTGTNFDETGRWISGPANAEIFKEVSDDLRNTFDFRIDLHELISSLKFWILHSESNNKDMNATSWGNEFGVLISANQAKYILSLLEKLIPVKGTPSRCCGRCDDINDICVTDMICELHGTEGCEICWPHS